jgi:hypothetical protein
VHLLHDDPRVARVVYLESIGVSDALEQRRREWHRGFADLFAEKARHFEPDTPVEVLRLRALAAIGILDEVMVDHHLRDDPPDLDLVIDTIADIYAALGVDALLSERPDGYEPPPAFPPVSARAKKPRGRPRSGR